MYTRYFSRKDVDLICHRVVIAFPRMTSPSPSLTAMSFQFPGESISYLPVNVDQTSSNRQRQLRGHS